MVPLPPAERSCLKRSSTYACSPVGKARRVTINADANKTRLVPYYGRPAQSPELAKKCFYTQDDCARPAASRIICVSRNTERDLLNLYPRLTGKTTVVHHGSSFPGDPHPIAPLASPYLLYVGHRGGYKNSTLLHEVMRHRLCQDLHLVFLGGATPTSSELAHGLGNRITFIPQCSDDDLATWYRHAVALVYPSRYEGFGMPPLEAMQLGCPVLASNTSSLPEVVGDAGLLLDPGQSVDWALRIGQLIAAPTLRAKLSVAGQERAREFTWARCANQVSNIYQELLQNARRR